MSTKVATMFSVFALALVFALVTPAAHAREPNSGLCSCFFCEGNPSVSCYDPWGNPGRGGVMPCLTWLENHCEEPGVSAPETAVSNASQEEVASVVTLDPVTETPKDEDGFLSAQEAGRPHREAAVAEPISPAIR